MSEHTLITSRGIYLHLAFCPYICPYCDFAKDVWQPEKATRYLRALRTEIAAATPLPATTLFLGGGTPNTYAAHDIAEIVTAARLRFSLDESAEICIECNPDPELCTGFAAYRAAGITRISFGVQSFVAQELKTLGRRHSAEDAATAVKRAKAAGFDAISLDLIFGTPGQTLASLDESIDRALELDVPHLSIYGLTVEEDTPYATWRLREPALFDDDTKDAEFYARIIERLTAVGYEHYELSNFARPGYRSRHNSQYWSNDEYLGFGIGAATYRDGIRSVRTKDYRSYVEALESGLPAPAESERLPQAARVGEAIMLALRRSEGIEAADFRARYGVDVCARYASTIQDYSALGLLSSDARGFRLTPAGKFVANDVCAAFLEPAASA